MSLPRQTNVLGQQTLSAASHPLQPESNGPWSGSQQQLCMWGLWGKRRGTRGDWLWVQRLWLRESRFQKQWGKKLLELWFRHINTGHEDSFPQQRNGNCRCRQGPYFSRSPSGNWGNWTSVSKGCFSLQKWSISCSVVTDSCDPMDFNPLGSSVHGILQARVLKWVAIFFSRGSFRPRDQTRVPCVGRRVLYHLTHQGNPP